MDGDQARAFHREPQHGPEAEQGAAFAFDDEVGDFDGRLGVAVLELRLVVERPPAAGQQREGPRLVELRVVQDEQPGMAQQIRPHVVMVARVPHLIDDEIVGSAEVPRDEIVRPGLVIHIHVVLRANRGQELGAVRRNAGPHGRERGEPGEAGHPRIVDPP